MGAYDRIIRVCLEKFFKASRTDGQHIVDNGIAIFLGGMIFRKTVKKSEKPRRFFIYKNMTVAYYI